MEYKLGFKGVLHMFTMKKFISFFLEPMHIGLILGAVALYYMVKREHQWASRWFVMTLGWIALIHHGAFSHFLITPLERQYTSLLHPPKVPYIVVLGSGHHSNDKLSIIAQTHKTSLSRIGEGIRLYKQLDGAKLITSGYEGHDSKPHALVQKNVAVALGVRAEEIIPLSQPRDTQEEAMAVKEIVKSQPFILVTSAAHMPRSMSLFRKVGLSPIAAPTDYLSNGKVNFWAFRHKSLERTSSAFHEYIGLLYAKLRGFI
jgi:uncharacterized SAM-binding protein YcdF (DUF218 family)